MNLEQAFPWFVVLCMAGGGILAHHGGTSLMAGVAAGLAVGFLPLFLLGAIHTLMQTWCPQRPPCVCGKCNSEEYEYLGPMHRAEDNAYYYKCPHCEREYRSQGQKYDFKTENGYTPYMEKSKWHRWKRNAGHNH
jgi:hypothetical protein